jgi:hypothetical protein
MHSYVAGAQWPVPARVGLAPSGACEKEFGPFRHTPEVLQALRPWQA